MQKAVMRTVPGWSGAGEGKKRTRAEKRGNMGVSKKGRRRIQYKDQTFVWWVSEDDDDFGTVRLKVVSDDKKIVLSYRVGEGDYYVRSEGRLFQGKERSGCWELYEYPLKEPPIVVTPRFVHELIAWAVDGENAALIRSADSYRKDAE